MKVQIEKPDAQELTRIESEIRKTEFALTALGEERRALINKYLEMHGALPQDGQEVKINTLPDWSEMLIIK